MNRREFIAYIVAAPLASQVASANDFAPFGPEPDFAPFSPKTFIDTPYARAYQKAERGQSVVITLEAGEPLPPGKYRLFKKDGKVCAARIVSTAISFRDMIELHDDLHDTMRYGHPRNSGDWTWPGGSQASLRNHLLTTHGVAKSSLYRETEYLNWDDRKVVSEFKPKIEGSRRACPT